MINETLIIERGFIISLIVITIWKCFQPQMILGFIGNWLERKYPLWLRFPICECPVCMQPYYGGVIYWMVWGQSWQEWILCIGVAMGIATFFTKIK
mgnify:CR=1 FL=1